MTFAPSGQAPMGTPSVCMPSDRAKSTVWPRTSSRTMKLTLRVLISARASSSGPGGGAGAARAAASSTSPTPIWCERLDDAVDVGVVAAPAALVAHDGVDRPDPAGQVRHRVHGLEGDLLERHGERKPPVARVQRGHVGQEPGLVDLDKVVRPVGQAEGLVGGGVQDGRERVGDRAAPHPGASWARSPSALRSACSQHGPSHRLSIGRGWPCTTPGTARRCRRARRPWWRTSSRRWPG